jgi:5-methylcytosine-specific restriction endonuclease McrA
MSNIPASVQQRVRQAAGNRCGYCLSPQRYVMGKLEIEHIIPTSLGGTNDEINLWLSCGLCNRYKAFKTSGYDPHSGKSVPLFNPRAQIWSEHFQWSRDGTRINGLTSIGRATVEAIHLNNELAVEVRRHWVLAGWHPPKENDIA